MTSPEGSVRITEGTPERLPTLENTRTSAMADLLAAPVMRGSARSAFALLYALCPFAHLAAFDAAMARARGVYDEAPFLEAAILERTAVRIEAVIESMRVLVMDTARVLGRAVPREVGLRIGALRSELSRAGSLFLQEEPDLQQIRARLTALGQTVPETAGRILFGVPPGELLGGHNLSQQLVPWAQANQDWLPAAAMLLTLQQSGEFQVSAEIGILPRQEIDGNAWLAGRILEGAASGDAWVRSPQVGGRAVYTGAFAHDFDTEEAETTPARMFLARLLSVAFQCVNGLHPDTEPLPVWTYCQTPGEAAALVRTARGLLAHVVRVDDDENLQALRIISPTEWHFARDGAGQRLLSAWSGKAAAQGRPLSGETFRQSVSRLLLPVDACVPLEFLPPDSSHA